VVGAQATALVADAVPLGAVCVAEALEHPCAAQSTATHALVSALFVIHAHPRPHKRAYVRSSTTSDCVVFRDLALELGVLNHLIYALYTVGSHGPALGGLQIP
jgi:hypothetical protein